jgi:hypothetical protein
LGHDSARVAAHEPAATPAATPKAAVANGSPGLSASGALDIRSLLSLQRLVGNAAVARLVKLRSANAVLQRDPDDPDEVSGWKEVGGPDLIAALTQECAAWSSYRSEPTTNAAMPGKAVAGKVSAVAGKMIDLRNRDAALYFKVKNHATALLGGLTPDLIEMASFNAAFANIDDIFNGVAKKAPAHQYVLKVTQTYDLASEVVKPIEEIPQKAIDRMPEGAAKKLAEEAKKKAAEAAKKGLGILGKLKMSEVVVNYSSGAFSNWAWRKDLYVVGLTLTVSVTRKPDKTEGGIEPGTMTVDFKGEAKADPAPVAFWGPEDIGGFVTVASAGAGAKIPGASVEFTAAQVVRFAGSGPGGALQFGELRGFATKQNFTRGAEVSISGSLGGGGGWAFGGEAISESGDYEAKAVQQEQVLFRGGMKDFVIGQDVPIGSVFEATAKLIRQRVDAKRDEARAFEAELKGLGIDEPFKCSFLIEGYASRAWKAAKSDAERIEKNRDLSERRAKEVATMLERMFPEPHDFHTVGKGPSVATGAEEGVRPTRVPEEGADALKQQLREKYRREQPLWSDEEIEKAVEAVYGRTSEAGEYRAVDVTVVWSGHVVQYEPVAESRPDRPPRGGAPPGGDGRGGGEGGPPAPPPGGGGHGGAPAS